MLRRRRPDAEPAFPGFEDIAPAFDFLPDPAAIERIDPPEPAAPVAVEGAPFRVKVVRSARRKTTVGAQMVTGVLTISVPAWMPEVEVERWTAEMTQRFARKASTDAIDLSARANAIARRYDLPKARDIKWAEMTTRWGSCTVGTAAIRLSTRLAGFPDWVIDYVIVHELAHLEVPDHSARFWRVVERYPKAERARGYLMAKAGDDTDAD